MRQRRFLPSLKLLMALDAVVRHSSVTAAAAELNLTQSTVSRLILSLENQLGKELFTRQRRRLIPTAAAITYQQEVARALDTIQRASMSFVTNPDGGTLSLAVLPTFATRWLGPRLGTFLTENPGISVNMSTRIGAIDFIADPFDAAIIYGDGTWDQVTSLNLMDECVTACASPDFLATHQIAKPQDVASLPLLQLESRPSVWSDWCLGQGIEPVRGEGMLVDQFSMMIQAAISGLGIALLPDYLAQSEIKEGRLMPILQEAVPVSAAYWLIWPETRSEEPALHAFADWIAQA